jgi:hypothetical protein
MRIPEYQSAVITKEKLTRYLLSETHPRGSMKARWFFSLGYSSEKPEQLSDSLLNILENEAVFLEETKFGKKYKVLGMITGPNGKSGKILTLWIVPKSSRTPRLVTAYPST